MSQHASESPHSALGLGPRLSLVPSKVDTSSDIGLIAQESFCLLKEDCLVVWEAAAESIVTRLGKRQSNTVSSVSV